METLERMFKERSKLMEKYPGIDRGLKADDVDDDLNSGEVIDPKELRCGMSAEREKVIEELAKKATVIYIPNASKRLLQAQRDAAFAGDMARELYQRGQHGSAHNWQEDAARFYRDAKHYRDGMRM